MSERNAHATYKKRKANEAQQAGPMHKKSRTAPSNDAFTTLFVLKETRRFIMFDENEEIEFEHTYHPAVICTTKPDDDDDDPGVFDASDAQDHAATAMNEIFADDGDFDDISGYALTKRVGEGCLFFKSLPQGHDIMVEHSSDYIDALYGSGVHERIFGEHGNMALWFDNAIAINDMTRNIISLDNRLSIADFAAAIEEDGETKAIALMVSPCVYERVRDSGAFTLL